MARLKQHAFHDPRHGEIVKLNQAMHSHAMSNDDYVILQIHDILESYYKVSRKTFVDNICKMAVMHFLLNADEGPLALLSPEFVSRLSSTQLEDIVGEAPAMKVRSPNKTVYR